MNPRAYVYVVHNARARKVQIVRGRCFLHVIRVIRSICFMTVIPAQARMTEMRGMTEIRGKVGGKRVYGLPKTVSQSCWIAMRSPARLSGSTWVGSSLSRAWC